MRKLLFSALILAALGSGPAIAGSSSAYIDQIGRDNAVSITQNGSNNFFETRQRGQRNETSLLQSGSGNFAVVNQTGNRNQAAGLQTGTMAATITQNGNRHEATFSSNVTANPNAPPVTITQFGTGAKVSVRTIR
ncbi:hypothetical protein JL100_027260 [Skermanella mucosa]|uniref:hypothetical protein n=1 Tax=Skermanella TaxID=204447 RepID=UPI00192A7B96|nr:MULTISPECIES: hypothetical protein [Skermanella]UEM03308.1 hypothetical protein JL101_025625 [Skermanella rosea]UEM20734.1 hypothetical protein JL100_027260 [Skermanella mucosa]